MEAERAYREYSQLGFKQGARPPSKFSWEEQGLEREYRGPHRARRKDFQHKDSENWKKKKKKARKKRLPAQKSQGIIPTQEKKSQEGERSRSGSTFQTKKARTLTELSYK